MAYTHDSVFMPNVIEFRRAKVPTFRNPITRHQHHEEPAKLVVYATKSP